MAESSFSTSDSVREPPFKSLAMLREEHGELLSRRTFMEDEATHQAEFLSELERFAQRVRDTGGVLESHAEREAAQAILSFWSNYMYRAGRDSPVVTLVDFDPQIMSAQCELSEDDYPYPKPNEIWTELTEIRCGEFVPQSLKILAKAAPRLLALIGPRNSGRSAIVKFGLLPALRGGALPGSLDWCYYPTLVLGSKPLLDLARHFQPGSGEEDADEWCERQVAKLRQDPTHLRRLVDSRRSQPTLLVVENFEQLLKRSDETDSGAFVDNLLTLCGSEAVSHCVILEIHSDFRGEYDQLVESRHLTRNSYLLIKPIDSEQLQLSIETPADRIGMRFREGLVEQLVVDVLGVPASVPLLLINLRELWKRRQQNWITWDAYYEAGGAHILERCFENFFQEDLNADDRDTLKRILLRLVRPSLGAEVVCPWVPCESLYDSDGSREAVDRILAALLSIGFIKSDEPLTDRPSRIAVTHAGLVAHISRLTEWLDAERMDKRQRLRLTAAAQQWKERSRDEGALWSSPSLVGETLQLTDPPLTLLEAEFLRESQAWIQRDEDAKKRRRKFREAVYVVAVVVAGVIVALTIGLWRSAEEERAHKIEEIGMSSLRDGDLSQAMSRFIEASQASQDEKFRESLHVRNAVSYRQLPRLVFLPQSRDQGEITFASFSPNGKIIATLEKVVQKQTTVFKLILWNPVTGKDITTKTLSANRIIDRFTDLRFSTDGSFLIATYKAKEETSKVEQFNTIVYQVNETNRQLVEKPDFNDVRSISVRPAGVTTDENEAILLTVGGDRRTLKFWKSFDSSIAPIETVKAEELLGEIEIVHAALSPDGLRWLAMSRQKNAGQSVQSLHLGKIGDNAWPESEPTFSRANVRKAQFSPDGQLLVTIEPAVGEELGPVRIRSLAKDYMGDPFELTSAGASDVLLSPNFKHDGILAATMETTVVVWKVQREEGSRFVARFLAQLPHGAVRSVGFSNDGRYVVTGSRDQSARVWNIEAEGKPLLRSPTYHGGTVDKVEFGDNGKRLLVKVGDTVSVWEIEKPDRINATARAVAISPNGQRLVIGEENGRIAVWNSQTLKDETTEREYTEAPADRLIIDSANQILVAVVKQNPDAKREVVAWDLTSGQNAAMNFQSPPSGDVSFVAFNHAGNQLLILEEAPGETATDETIGCLSVWQHDGKTWKTHVDRFEISNTQEEKIDANRHKESVLWAAFDSESRFIATGSKDDSVRIWRVESEGSDTHFVGMIRKENANEKDFTKEWPKGHPADVTCLAFGHGRAGNFLVTASANGNAKVWEFRGDGSVGKKRCHVEHTGGQITRVAISQDGSRFVTVGTDRRVCLWSVDDGTLLGVFPHVGKVGLPVFRGDGAMLFTADFRVSSGRVAFHDWNLNIEDEQKMREYTEIVAARDVSRLDRGQVQERRRKWLNRSRGIDANHDTLSTSLLVK